MVWHTKALHTVPLLDLGYRRLRLDMADDANTFRFLQQRDTGIRRKARGEEEDGEPHP